jgi:UDP-N-acetylglucosamine:LPS N-acetylglucosamine transferase
MLVDRVKRIISSPARLQTMIEAVRSFAQLEATQAIVATILEMAKVKVTDKPKHEVLSI